MHQLLEAIKKERVKLYARWDVEHIRKGRRIGFDRGKNLIVDTGLAYILGAALDPSIPKIPTLYVGLYTANRTPLSTDTGTSYPTDAVETTLYAEAARPQYNGVLDPGPPILVTNAAARAEFTFTGSVTIYGGFVISLSPKGTPGGTLVNARAFVTPRFPVATDVLRITVQYGLAGV